MKQLESEGKHYDIDDIALSDDEKGDYIERLAEARLREKKDYDDEPYKVAQDEEKAVEKQYDEIKSKLDALQGKAEDGEKLKPGDQLYQEYENILNSMEDYHDLGFRLDHKTEQEQLQKEEMKEFERLAREEGKIRDSLYSRREKREGLKKTGGARSESPVWRDD